MGSLRLNRFCVAVFLVCIACVLSSRAQGTDPDVTTPAPVESTPDQTPLPLPTAQIPDKMQADLTPPAVSDSYQIGKDDLLSIFVFQMPELTSQVRVNDRGMIRIPVLNQSITAAGKTTPELAQEIAEDLVQAQIARAPQVRVMVRQVMSRPIVVAGAVKNPIVIQASRPMRLLEVLARAGGLQSMAGTSILLTQTLPDGSPIIRTVDLNRVMNSQDPASNPVLHGGDEVRVVDAKFVYATGALQRPGAFPIKSGEPLTVLKTLALSEGFSALTPADKKHSEIIRSSKDGRFQEIPVDLDKILQHKSADQILEAGDILYVPENGRKKVLTTVLQDVGQAVVIAVGYNATNF